MRFWIQCTRFETGQTVHINIALVGSMWREADRTMLAFVGDNAENHRGHRNAGAIARTAFRPAGKGMRR